MTGRSGDRSGIMKKNDVARAISYASPAQPKGGRALIRILENVTGRLSLIRRAEGYETEVDRGRSFWQVIPERFGLSLDVVGGTPITATY
mgnify:CR=1 FL=1